MYQVYIIQARYIMVHAECFYIPGICVLWPGFVTASYRVDSREIILLIV